MSAVLVAVIVGLGTLLQIYVSGHQRRADKREDWAREDAVAKRVEEARVQAAEAASLLLDRQDAIAAQAREAAALLVKNNEAVAATAAATDDQLKKIHTLVNSNLTDALRGQLAATVGQLVALRRALGDPPDPGDLALIRRVEADVDRLTTDIEDRDAEAERVAEES